MKKIPEPKLESARILTPAEMNHIHFGGENTPVSVGDNHAGGVGGGVRSSEDVSERAVII